MAVAYSLTPELRRKLKQPLGTLIKGSFAETVNKFKSLTEKEAPSQIVSVGDIVSRNLVRNGVLPRLMIIDNRCMRRNIKEPDLLAADRTVYVTNPQATITQESVDSIRNALEGKNTVKIVVDGEEDLLTLAAVLHAPEGAFVVYGQPHLGMVVVRVNSEKKAEIARILEAMESARKAK
jgi:uncharacterized protein (UPF0218 family)